MKKWLLHSLTLILAILPRSAAAEEKWIVESGPQRVHLLELFSSEGCSSCPPAEGWLSGLRKQPGLWRSLVPVQFHVNYWDGLGWPDPYAKPEFTARQRRYATEWRSNGVYTPGFVVDGKERRGIPSRSFDGLTADQAGTLRAERLNEGQYSLTFRPVAKPAGSLLASAAVLGNELFTDVRAGENGGSRLRHDFIVLSLQTVPLRAAQDTYVASFKTPDIKSPALHPSIVFWVSTETSQEPLQAVGGDL